MKFRSQIESFWLLEGRKVLRKVKRALIKIMNFGLPLHFDLEKGQNALNWD